MKIENPNSRCPEIMCDNPKYDGFCEDCPWNPANHSAAENAGLARIIAARRAKLQKRTQTAS